MLHSRRDIQVDDLAVARLHVLGCTQQEIANRFRIDKAEVVRALKRTVGKFWQKSAPVEGPHWSQLGTALIEQVNDRITGKSHRPIRVDDLHKLAPSEWSHLKTVTVIPARKPDDLANWSDWIAQYARHAAAAVRPLMGRTRIWGVTWGSHVSAVVDEMMRVGNGVRGPGPEIRVLPLCGNRCGERLTTESSSAIAERLGMELSGRVAAPGALVMVPAFILGDLTDEQALTSWMEISRSPGYCEIFGDGHIPKQARPLAARAQPCVQQLGGVLTSVSRDGRPFGYGETRMYENAGYDAASIEGAYLGDVGGVGLVKPDQSPLPLVEERWTGVRRSELRACAARAAQPGNHAPGVVVLASGPVRASSLIESVRQGYVSHAVIDESLNAELAERLIRLGRPPAGKQPTTQPQSGGADQGTGTANFSSEPPGQARNRPRHPEQPRQSDRGGPGPRC